MPALPTLRRRADFEALGRQGSARAHGPLVIRFLRTERDETRVGLSTPRTLGGAVARNRVRRRLRQLVRERLAAVGPGWDLLLIARPSATQVTYGELAGALDELIRRSGINQ